MMKKSSEFVLEWEKALGWSDNPFQDKIFEPVEQFIVGYDKERQKLNLFVIENYRYGILLGEEGNGKTTLLRWMRNQLAQYHSRFAVLYLNARNIVVGEFIKRLVTPFLNPLELYITRPWKKLHIGNVVEFLKPRLATKNLIILVDEAQMFTKADALILKHLFDSNIHVQLIVAGSPEEMKRSVVATFAPDQLNIVLHGLKLEEIKEMLTMRIEALGGQGIEPFDHEMLTHIARDHQNNPKRVLALCNDHAVKLSLKHAFTKQIKQHPHPKSKFFIVENVEEKEDEPSHELSHKSKLTDIFLPGLLDEPKKQEPASPSVAVTEDVIQQAAAEIQEAAKHARKKKKE